MQSDYKYVNKEVKLDFGEVYHIYNKAIGNELLFRTEDDYFFFLKKLERYIYPVAEIYSYCLLPNHFHLLIKSRHEHELKEILKRKSMEEGGKVFHQSFSNFFNSYSKSYNKVHKRSGRLFLYPFKRILVDKDDYLLIMVNYYSSKSYSLWFSEEFF